MTKGPTLYDDILQQLDFMADAEDDLKDANLEAKEARERISKYKKQVNRLREANNGQTTLGT